MSLPRPVHPYYFQADRIWWDSPFNSLHSYQNLCFLPRREDNLISSCSGSVLLTRYMASGPESMANLPKMRSKFCRKFKNLFFLEKLPVWCRTVVAYKKMEFWFQVTIAFRKVILCILHSNFVIQAFFLLLLKLFEDWKKGQITQETN